MLVSSWIVMYISLKLKEIVVKGLIKVDDKVLILCICFYLFFFEKD